MSKDQTPAPANEAVAIVGRSRGGSALRMNKAMRESMDGLLMMRFRARPFVDLAPTYSIEEMLMVLNSEIKGLPEYMKAAKAMANLTAAVLAKYDAPQANIQLGTTGELSIAHETRYGDGANDPGLVGHERRKRNAHSNAINGTAKAPIKKETEAWELELKEKRNVIACSATVEQVLALVPEVRVNLPTEFDRGLNVGYRMGQLTTGDPPTLDAVLA